jgi:hypothetical protein
MRRGGGGLTDGGMFKEINDAKMTKSSGAASNRERRLVVRLLRARLGGAGTQTRLVTLHVCT